MKRKDLLKVLLHRSVVTRDTLKLTTDEIVRATLKGKLLGLNEAMQIASLIEKD